MKYKAGSFLYHEEEKYYTEDFATFYKENNEMLKGEDLEYWSVWLNSPWSQAHEKYIISCNCKDAYTEMDKEEPIWKCEYSVVGYDGISTTILGYGNTEIAALEECKMHFQILQELYNPNKESF